MSYRDYVLVFAPAGVHSLQAMVLFNQTKESFAGHAKDFPGEPHHVYWGPPVREPAEPTFLPSVVLFGPTGHYFLEEMGGLPELIEKLDLLPMARVSHMQVAQVFAFSPGIPTTVYPAGRDGPPIELKGEALLMVAGSEGGGCGGDCGECDCDEGGRGRKKGMH